MLVTVEPTADPTWPTVEPTFVTVDPTACPIPVVVLFTLAKVWLDKRLPLNSLGEEVPSPLETEMVRSAHNNGCVVGSVTSGA